MGSTEPRHSIQVAERREIGRCGGALRDKYDTVEGTKTDGYHR